MFPNLFAGLVDESINRADLLGQNPTLVTNYSSYCLHSPHLSAHFIVAPATSLPWTWPHPLQIV